MFEIDTVPVEPRLLTQRVLQITSMLGLYQAELARILGIRCGDIGRLSSGREVLQPADGAWSAAGQFVRFYQLLFTLMEGDGVAMRHWLCVENDALGGIPHRLLVDHGHLAEVVGYLERSVTLSSE